jgi:hypothetical protein
MSTSADNSIQLPAELAAMLREYLKGSSISPEEAVAEAVRIYIDRPLKMNERSLAFAKEAEAQGLTVDELAVKWVKEVRKERSARLEKIAS